MWDKSRIFVRYHDIRAQNEDHARNSDAQKEAREPCVTLNLVAEKCGAMIS